MAGPEVTFLFQFGNLRDIVTVDASILTLKVIKDLACDFINTKVRFLFAEEKKVPFCDFNRIFFQQLPDNGVNHLPERLLLFRHDYQSANVLQLINSTTEITDEAVVEIVLTANRKLY